MAGYYFAFGAGDADNYYLVPGAMDDWRRMNRETDCVDRKIDMDLILSALPPNKRRAVTLYMEGYTYREIADKAGVTENCIRQVMKHLRAKLRNSDTF